LQFQVDLDGDGTYNTAMVFEPYYSTQASGGVQPNVTPQTWQTWNAAAGKWWFTKWPDATSTPVVKSGHTYCKSDCFNSFADIQLDFPNAKILTWFNSADGYGTQFQAGMNSVGAPWQGFDGNIDNFSITVNSVASAFDFEPLLICYVNAATGDDATKGGTSATDAKKTIQACINITGSGGTVIVAAGTYAENPRVDRPLTLQGPNAAINPNTGTPVAEALIVPAGNAYNSSSTAGAVITLAADNITIRGFTIDGNNANVSGGTALNGVDVNAYYGITNDFTGSTINALANTTTIQNNVIKNLGEGIDLGATSTPSTGTTIADNALDNMSSGTDFGKGIVLADNFYAAVTGNVITRVYTGIQTNNFSKAGSPATISNNQVSSYQRGIFHNLQYGTASTFTIANNTLTTADYTTWTSPGAVTNVNNNTGLNLYSIQDSVSVVLTNNNASGASVGIGVGNIPTTSTLTISGGTLNNNAYGLKFYSCDVRYGAGAASTLNVHDLTITGSTTVGLAALDNPTAKSVADGNGPACTGITNPITLLAQNIKETGTGGTSIGALADGAKANVGVTGSTFQANGTGIKVSTLAHVVASGLHFNVIVANPTAGLDANTAGGAVDATNNWWGCNTGPNSGNGACDTATGVGANANPWLTLRITRTPAVASTAPNSSFAIVADLVINSAAIDTSASGTVQNGTAIAFAVAPAGTGTITPASGGTTAGKVTASFVAGASGCPVISATSDDQTVSTSVCINAAPTPTPITPTATPSPSPTPSTIPTPATPAVTAYTVSASISGPGAISPTGTSSYNAGTQATYTAVATGNAVFVGWTLDGVYVGYASPLNFVVNNNRTLVATFAARSAFSDVSTTDPDYQAITFLTALGIINPNGVNGSGQFQPDRAVNRAEISAFIARLFGWEGEFHANNFPDRCLPSDPNNCIDARLWNDVAALKDYGVVGGYTDSNTCTAAGTTAPCYLPRDSVKRVQVLSIIARSFIKTPDLRPTGFWDRLAANGAQYTNVGTEGTQRSDLTTYRTNAGPIPGQASDATFPNPEGDGSRRFVIEALFQAFAAQFSVDRVP